MLLGAVDVTPIEAAQLYNGLANGGFRNPLRARARGHQRRRQSRSRRFRSRSTPVAAPGGGVRGRPHDGAGHGAGHRSARARGAACESVVAGKSGTSSDLRDSWFAGFSGSHVVVVWVGYDDDLPTGLTGSAGRSAGVGAPHGRLAGDLLGCAHARVPRRDLDRLRTGQRVEKGCSQDAVPIAVPGRHAASGESRLTPMAPIRSRASSSAPASGCGISFTDARRQGRARARPQARTMTRKR